MQVTSPLLFHELVVTVMDLKVVAFHRGAAVLKQRLKAASKSMFKVYCVIVPSFAGASPSREFLRESPRLPRTSADHEGACEVHGRNPLQCAWKIER